MNDRWIVLDAMGVLYRSADDVADLLIPYARKHGSAATPERIIEVYREASLGRMSSDELWRALGIAASASDDDYCRLNELTAGLREFLARDHDARYACLSNDVSEWSLCLRRRFGLEDLIEEWVISGDVGARKPDPEIYALAAERLGADGASILFVDDRPRNLDAAVARGWETAQFGGISSAHRTVQSFAELSALISPA
jgi:HAD superfamily hydrolase (TIGR01549 family)